MTREQKVEILRKLIEDATPEVMEKSGKLILEAFAKSNDEYGPVATTTAAMVAAATALAGAPPPLRGPFLKLFTDSLNEMSGGQVIGVVEGIVREAKKDEKTPIGFFNQSPAKA